MKPFLELVMLFYSLFYLQALLLGLGLQHKTVEDLEKELDLPSSQLLGLFNRIIRKVVNVSLTSWNWRKCRILLAKSICGGVRKLLTFENIP